MYVFINWTYVSVAEKAELTRAEWVQQLLQEDKQSEQAAQLTIENCLPEYAEYLAALEAEKLSVDDFDKLNRDLLSVRIAIPELGKVVAFKLPRRTPDTNKLPVSLAVRAYLLNTFKGEWTGNLFDQQPQRLVLAGPQGLQDFVLRLTDCCGVLGQPMPVDFWQRPVKMAELREDQHLRDFLNACRYNQADPGEQEKFRSLLAYWLGTGASADIDGPITIATAMRLGME